MSRRTQLDSSDDDLFNDSQVSSKQSSVSRKSKVFKRARISTDESEEEALNLSVRPSEKVDSITPSGFESDAKGDASKLLKDFDARMDNMLQKYRMELNEIHRKEKASNAEFLNLADYLILGEQLSVDNSAIYPEFVIRNINLIALQAGPEPSKFSRDLAKQIFGEG